MRWSVLASLLAIATALVASTAAAPTTATLPPRVTRVLVLGDSITHGGAYVNYLETYFLTRHPQRALEWINVGLPSETVSGLSEPGHADGKFPRPDLHERLGRILPLTQPDLVFACYGMNEGIYLPLAEERFAKFRAGMQWLHEQVTRTRAAIIHLTPPVYDEARGGKPGYAATLDRYADWLLQQQGAAQWRVIDVHAAMQRALAHERQTDPAFSYARDGVHPNDAGHWVIARAVLIRLGARDVADDTELEQMLGAHPHGREILALVAQRQAMMKLAWLTATQHQRPGIKPGLPLDEARAKAAELGLRIAALQR